MSHSGDVRRGVRFGVDVGSVRVGVAKTDPSGILATPVATIDGRDTADSIRQLCRLIHDEQVVEVVVGLPRSLSGEEGPAARTARRYAQQLAAECSPVPVRLVDERLTTVSAHRALHAAGRKERQHRTVVDQAAAVIILEQALDVERRTGHAPGELVEHSPVVEEEA